MHRDKYRNLPFHQLLDLSLPYAEVDLNGKVCISKAEGSGGVLNFSTCAEQLLYEVADPAAYITPDVVSMIIDIQDVSFHPVSSDKILCTGAKPSKQCLPTKLLQLVPKKSGSVDRHGALDVRSTRRLLRLPLRLRSRVSPPRLLLMVTTKNVDWSLWLKMVFIVAWQMKDCGWKGWGEISYGGHGCVKRAEVAELLVRSWMDESFTGCSDQIVSYVIGLNSLRATDSSDGASSLRNCDDLRLRMDGLFELEKHACHFLAEFTALYTNGPAGGGGISTGHKKEIILENKLVARESVFWKTESQRTVTSSSCREIMPYMAAQRSHAVQKSPELLRTKDDDLAELQQPAPSGKKIPLYEIAHSRAGDKGNDLNFSIIPHFPQDIERLKVVITPSWVKHVVSSLLDNSSFPSLHAIKRRNSWVDEHVTVDIYEVKGIHSLNAVVRNILDGGVNCSRRIDRHGKTISDLVLCQQVVLPP
ncbi:hypothetical protein ACLOJK_015626 [Asimina triloba]